MRYKVWKFGENRVRDTIPWGVYIPHFGQIWVKISIVGVVHPCRCTDKGEIWQVPSSVPNFTPIGTTCRPCRAKILKIGLSKLNTGRLALCAMLLVITLTTCSVSLIAHSAYSLMWHYIIIRSFAGRQHHLDVALLLSFEWIHLNNNRYN